MTEAHSFCFSEVWQEELKSSSFLLGGFYRFIIDLVKFVHGDFFIESEKEKGNKVTIKFSCEDETS
jgi:hypothetical protein